jgi:hypothetical protein
MSQTVEIRILKKWACKAFVLEPGMTIHAHWMFAEQLIDEGVATLVATNS